MAGLPRDGARPLREREFHAWLARELPSGRDRLLPLGDDAAALLPPHGTVAVVSTDTLVEGTHFVADSPPHDVGRAASAVSLSDVASKGAVPRAVLIALVVPATGSRRWAMEVVRGAEAEAEAYGARIVGGDTKPGPVRAVASTAVGWAHAGRLVPRSGARPGDVLATTGVVGRGGLAFERLRSGEAPRRRLLRELLSVHPRVREGLALARFAHAMLDTSDGLAESCRLMAGASRVRLVVDEPTLPLAPGVARAGRTAARRRRIAFFGGDYELLAAIPPHRLEEASRAVARLGNRLHRIGSVVPGHGTVLRNLGRTIPMPAAGWDPFARRGLLGRRDRVRRVP